MNNFGFAVEQLKAGKKVARSGWNGKGMYLSLKLGTCPNGINPPKEYNSNLFEKVNMNYNNPIYLPSIIMNTATGNILIGWLASQSDILSEDWIIIDE